MTGTWVFPRLHAWEDSTLAYGGRHCLSSLSPPVALLPAPPAGSVPPLIRAPAGIAPGRVVRADAPTQAKRSAGLFGAQVRSAFCPHSTRLTAAACRSRSPHPQGLVQKKREKEIPSAAWAPCRSPCLANLEHVLLGQFIGNPANHPLLQWEHGVRSQCDKTDTVIRVRLILDQRWG